MPTRSGRVIRLRVLLPGSPASERAELKRLLAHLN